MKSVTKFTKSVKTFFSPIKNFYRDQYHDMEPREKGQHLIPEAMSDASDINVKDPKTTETLDVNKINKQAYHDMENMEGQTGVRVKFFGSCEPENKENKNNNEPMEKSSDNNTPKPQ